jgi:hypothetical protein
MIPANPLRVAPNSGTPLVIASSSKRAEMKKSTAAIRNVSCPFTFDAIFLSL